jgi:hypothetical protein
VDELVVSVTVVESVLLLVDEDETILEVSVSVLVSVLPKSLRESTIFCVVSVGGIKSKL